jgi:hypothetical protein
VAGYAASLNAHASMTGLGHSRRGLADSKPGYVRLMATKFRIVFYTAWANCGSFRFIDAK